MEFLYVSIERQYLVRFQIGGRARLQLGSFCATFFERLGAGQGLSVYGLQVLGRLRNTKFLRFSHASGDWGEEGSGKAEETF